MMKLIKLFILMVSCVSSYAYALDNTQAATDQSAAYWDGKIYTGAWVGDIFKGKQYSSCQDFIKEFNEVPDHRDFHLRIKQTQTALNTSRGKATFKELRFRPPVKDKGISSSFVCVATGEWNNHIYYFSFSGLVDPNDSENCKPLKDKSTGQVFWRKEPGIYSCTNVVGHGYCRSLNSTVQKLNKPHEGRNYMGEGTYTGERCLPAPPQDKTNPTTKPISDTDKPKFENCGGAEICKKPNDKFCDWQGGYTSGTMNGQTYCIKKAPDSPSNNQPQDPKNPDKPDKDLPPPEPPDDTSSNPPETAEQIANNPVTGGGGSTGDSGTPNGGTTGNSTGTSGTGKDTNTGNNTDTGGTGKDSNSDKDSDGKDGLLESLFDWLKQDNPLPSPDKPNITDISNNRTVNTSLYTSNAQCPQPRELRLQGYPISYNFSFQPICDGLNMLSFMIMALAYVYGAYIISKS